MKITCDVAKDLAEIYLNGSPSEDTCRAVKSHLKECRNCRVFYSDYKDELDEAKRGIEKKFSVETSPYIADEILSESLKKISKRLRKRRIITNTIGTVTAVIGLIVAIGELVLMLKEDQADNGND